MPKKIATPATEASTSSEIRVGIAYAAFFNMFAKHFPGLTIINNVSEVKNYDLIIFSGGEDLDPKLYGESNVMSYDANPARDAHEMAIFKEADKLGTLMYGSCRGLQLINVGRGGTLHQDLRQAGMSHMGRHPLTWELTSKKLQPIFADVNSLHHQGIRNLGKNLFIYASHSNVPEIIYDKNIMATQFHPEMMTGMEPFFQLLKDWVADKKKPASSPVPAEA